MQSNSSSLIEISATHLRRAVPLMTKYGIALTPPNYAVWYAYVAGENEALSQTLERAMSRNDPIDDGLTAQLFRQYLMPKELGDVEALKAHMQALVRGVSRDLDTANVAAARYGDSLAKYSSQLSDTVSAVDLQGLITELASDTHRMQSASAELQQRLTESQEKAEQLRAELARARQEAQTDALTGLANRRAFDQHFARLLQAQASMGHCLLLGDIDKFKAVNDDYGHPLGDKVIAAVAEVIKTVVQSPGLGARFGGEEFAVLLPDTRHGDGLNTGQRIRQLVERSRIVKPKSGEALRQITISLGLATFSAGEAAADVIARCDEALYRAKANGRNRVEIAESESTPAAASA